MTFRTQGLADYDSGWIAFSYATNWGNEGGTQTGRYRKVCDRVYVQVMAARSTSVSGTDSTVGTLPTGFRPPAAFHFPTITNAGGTFTTQRGSMNTDGTVHVYTSVAVGASVPLLFDFAI